MQLTTEPPRSSLSIWISMPHPLRHHLMISGSLPFRSPATDPTVASTPTLEIRRIESLLLAGHDREALELARASVARHPGAGIAWKLLGVAAQREAAFDLSLLAKREAARLLPTDADVHVNLANALRLRGEFVEAQVCLERAVALEPLRAPAHNLLGLVLQGQGQIERAREAFEAALRADPQFVQAHSNLLFMLTHEGAISAKSLAEAHRRFGAIHGDPLRGKWPRHTNSREPDRRLRLGFVSADFRSHPVARFIAPIWAAIDRKSFELLAYNVHWRRDSVTEDLQSLCDGWMDAHRLSDSDLAARILNDGVDILFDLSGHTAHNRLMCFARKPAPLQVTAIGYPHSTGLSAMDYSITDAFRTPFHLANQYVECLAWIPSISIFEHGTAPDVAPLPALAGKPFTFGSFQRPSKIGLATLDLWAAVMNAVPESRLRLGAINGMEVRRRLAEALQNRGIAAGRLDFNAVQPMRGYLESHSEVDLLLDTVPYPAGTTAHHGLWMGVPTITRTSDSIVSWQCAGTLGQLGLREFIANDDATFISIAMGWSRRKLELAALRANLREQIRRHPMLQPLTVTRGVEAALREMWRRWCAGQPSHSFEVCLEH